MTFSASIKTMTESKIKRNLAALDEAVALMRREGQDNWANDIADVRDFIARSKAYYERIATKNTPRPSNARDLAEVMWSDIKRRK